MKIALDVNRYVDFCDGQEEVVHHLRRAREIVMPFVTVAELRAGFRCSTRCERNEAALSRFLQSDRVTVLFPDDGTSHFYARLFVDLKRAGTPIPTNDLWIASLVLQHDLVLYSRDRHFDLVPSLPRL